MVLSNTLAYYDKATIMAIESFILQAPVLMKESKAGLLNKSTCLATALAVTKFTAIIGMLWVTLCCAAQD
jgi:hypothetical protein